MVVVVVVVAAVVVVLAGAALRRLLVRPALWQAYDGDFVDGPVDGTEALKTLELYVGAWPRGAR